MPPTMLFVIGAPRSGTTMLERMLGAHPAIQGGPEPHILTPLAHLGVWDKVGKAPYDHVLAAESQKLFVSKLPNGEEDYWRACRAYCDVLYGQFMSGRDASICLDKTPAYGLILPFMAKVFPDATYVVLTRHPAAMFSSFANSFFDGDYETAHAYNPIVDRYVPALANFLCQDRVPFLHVRYEDLVLDPEAWFEKICAHIGIPYEAAAVEYGGSEGAVVPREGLGDPLGVQQHTRPSVASVDKWARELTADEGKRAFMRKIIERLDPADLDTLGYSLDTFWAPLESMGEVSPPSAPKLNRYRMQRKLIIALRRHARSNPLLRKILERVRLTCDVLLRE